MKINLEVVMMIESSGDPEAHNPRSGARGLFQITSPCLKEWNNYHPDDRHIGTDLYKPDVNRKIAEWYLDNRIPSMLRAYGMPVTVDMILAAYNWGIGNLYRAHKRSAGYLLPMETAEYIQKYKDLAGA